MGDFIVTVADAFGLTHPHVVAPGSGAAAVPLQLGGMVKDIVEAPDLDRFREADPRQLVNAALSSISRYAPELQSGQGVGTARDDTVTLL
jgi:hypothetical protein